MPKKKLNHFLASLQTLEVRSFSSFILFIFLFIVSSLAVIHPLSQFLLDEQNGTHYPHTISLFPGSEILLKNEDEVNQSIFKETSSGLNSSHQDQITLQKLTGIDLSETPGPASLVTQKVFAIMNAEVQSILGQGFLTNSKKAAHQSHEVFEKSLLHLIEKSLAPKWRHLALEINQAILKYSHDFDFDPILLLAVIENESSFNPEAIGPVGELGLMQVTEKTGEWIAKKFGWKWKGKQFLKNPSYNIKLGTAYLSLLKQEFDKACHLYLSAYNMGSGAVKNFLDKDITPSRYSSLVLSKYMRWHEKLIKFSLHHSVKDVKRSAEILLQSIALLNQSFPEQPLDLTYLIRTEPPKITSF